MIPGTVPAADEERRVSAVLASSADVAVWVYGRHSTDKTPYRKAEQLLQLGISNVAVYPGGMLEWALLADACGEATFPLSGTLGDVLDFLP